MASDEEIYKIIAKVEGDMKVKDLGDKVQDLEGKLREMIALWGPNSVGAKHFADELAQTTQEMKTLSAASGKSGGGAANMLTQLGYAADDAQYGFKGIANNIQPILSSIPGLAGLAPVISIAAIAAYQLYEHWDQLATLFGQGRVKTQAEEMDELSKKTSKTADETARLLKLEQERAHIQAQHRQPKDQSETGQNIDEAVRDAPVATIEDAVKIFYEKEIRRGVDPEVRKNRDKTQNDLRAAQEFHKRGALRADQVKGFEDIAKDAQEEYDKRLQEQVEKKVASLSVTDRKGDPKNLKDFMGRLGKRPDLQPNPEAMDRLKAAQITPQEKRELEKARKQQEADKAAEQAELNETFDESQRDLAEKKRLKDAKDKKDAKDREVKEAEDEAAHNNFLSDAKGREDAEKASKQKSKDDLDRAKETPGIESAIRTQLKAMYQGGASPVEAQAMLADKLSDHFGRGTANALVAGQAEAAQEERMMDYLNGDQSKHRNSQVIGAEGLAASIQSAVGGDDTAKKQLEQQKLAADYLRQIANSPRGSGIVGFNAQGNATVG